MAPQPAESYRGHSESLRKHEGSLLRIRLQSMLSRELVPSIENYSQQLQDIELLEGFFAKNAAIRVPQQSFCAHCNVQKCTALQRTVM